MSAEIDLTGDGGVKKRILRESKADALSPSDSHPIADVHYEGRLLDTGDIFDSSREDNAVFTFEVGKGKVIRAWDIAVKTMKVGEVSLITCRSDYAYGDDGAPPEIPPGATLVFEVELMAVKPPRGASADTMVAEKSRLEELRREREASAKLKEEEKKKREEAKAAAASRLQDKLAGKKGGGGGKGGAKKK